MSLKSNKLTPSIAIHPGEILKDELNARGINQKEFAQLTGIPQTQLNEMIKGKRGIYADTAIVIGKVLQMDALLWTNLQMNYEIDLARLSEKNKARIEAIDIWEMMKDFAPVKFLKKQGILSGNPMEDIPMVKELYNVKNAEQLALVYSQTNYARFRKSDKLTIDKINLIGWVKLVAYKAAKLQVPKFDSRKKNELVENLNIIFRKNKNTIDKTTELLASYGIKLVVLPHPEKCAVDGISFWSNGNPAIGLTVRHKRIDNFSFTVLHELGHVFLHLVNNNTAEFIDLDKNHNGTDYKNSKEEKEANEFARNAMVDKNIWDLFMKTNPDFNEDAIRSFASLQKVHPAIAKGRFMFETDCFNIRSAIDSVLQ